MKIKLVRFQDFAATLLPHETGWLLKHHQFTDPEKITILEALDHNCQHPTTPRLFDEQIDKRKYSYIIQWVNERLGSIDVDEQLRQINHLDQQVAIDAITPGEEKSLSRLIKETDQRAFNFIRIYELVRNYRHFLLIRLRYRQHDEADAFLHTFKAAYEHARDVNDKIHYATQDIVRQYAGNAAESIQWERWLTFIFNDATLDGHNRYMALVRLTFLYFNYRQFDRLLDKMEVYDSLLNEGVYYSRRLLINYYSNRLLLHNALGQYEAAVRYGYLSIRSKNTDYIHYVNTLTGVLLKLRRDTEALDVLRNAHPELRQDISFHNRLLFMSHYLNALERNGLFKNAENYGESFIRAYSEEIFDHRWHMFFVIFFNVLFYRDKTARVYRLSRKYRLLTRESEHIKHSGTLPILRWQYSLAAYIEMRITRPQLEAELRNAPLQADADDPAPGLEAFIVHLKRLAPEVWKNNARKDLGH